MAFHLPLVALAAVGAGLARGVVAAAQGDDLGESFKKGFDTSCKTAFVVGTFGIISPDSGIDISGDQIAYDPDHSCNT